ncbi:MAG TPA: hypothetical protein VFD60_10475 [Nitrososphaeraceae archaeon]|nr:hypothetical protein [Nitrososphaeraceae archaeon]
MSSSKEVVTLVVMMFLLVILIYSSVAKFDAFAKPKRNFSDILCTKNPAPNPGGINYSCCYFTNLLPDGKPGQQSQEYCADCQLKPDSSYACGDYHQVFRTTENPPLVGPAQPPSTALPPSGATSPPPVSPSPTKQQTLTTNTCPDGSQPDANGNCPTSPPPTATNQQVTPPTTTTSSHHHHKGSSNLQGQEPTPTTTTKKVKVPKTG